MNWCLLLPLSANNPSGLNLQRPCLCCYSLCEFIVSGRHWFLGITHLWLSLSVFASSSPYMSKPEGNSLRDTFHLVLSVSKSLTFCTLSSCGSLHHSHLLQKKASLVVSEGDTFSRLLGVILLLHSFSRIVFSFSPRLLAYLSPWPPKHCRHGLQHMGWP